MAARYTTLRYYAPYVMLLLLRELRYARLLIVTLSGSLRHFATLRRYIATIFAMPFHAMFQFFSR